MSVLLVSSRGFQARARSIVAGVCVLAIAGTARAQNSVSQTVVLRVVAPNAAAMSPVTAAVPARDASSSVARGTYAIATSDSAQKITASLDRALPRGVSMAVTLNAPAGATSIPTAPLTITDTDVVTNIPATTIPALGVRYAIAGAGSMASTDRTVVYTVLAAP